MTFFVKRPSLSSSSVSVYRALVSGIQSVEHLVQWSGPSPGGLADVVDVCPRPFSGDSEIITAVPLPVLDPVNRWTLGASACSLSLPSMGLRSVAARVVRHGSSGHAAGRPNR